MRQLDIKIMNAKNSDIGEYRSNPLIMSKTISLKLLLTISILTKYYFLFSEFRFMLIIHHRRIIPIIIISCLRLNDNS